jgi:hypothetical protein
MDERYRMSRTLFAAGRIIGPDIHLTTSAPFSGKGWERVAMHRTYNCTNPHCAEPREAITVSLRWEPGIGGIGLLAGWTAGDVTAHCGCVLAEHEVAALAARAEGESNG